MSNAIFTHYKMPVPSEDPATYWRQMYDWHMKMHQHYLRLQQNHLQRAMYNQKLIGGQATPADFKNDGSVA
jgi:hypothetical protein